MHLTPSPTTPIDTLINTLDNALRTLFAAPHASTACATLPEAPTQLAEAERAQAAGLMRVNHVGEICAQALYTAQALATRNPRLRAQYEAACAEEVDHLAWTAQRLDELGARPSLLNPLWYAGAFGLGLLAGRLGDNISLGFVVETERQERGAFAQGQGRSAPGSGSAASASLSGPIRPKRALMDCGWPLKMAAYSVVLASTFLT